MKIKSMPSIRVSQELNSAVYFLTITVQNWHYVLDRYDRWQTIAQILNFYQKNKGLKIYSFVFMINHLHLIIFSKDVAGFIRDFKKFTTKEILKNIKQTEPLTLKLFLNQDKRYRLWGKTNMPEIVETEKFLLQKMNYIYENPVKKEYVSKPEDWYWSSANPDCELKPNIFL